MKIKVSDYIAKFISTLGVKHVFLISGGCNVQMIDSIAKNNKLKYVCNHHEQASAMAAESYSRINQNIGVCMATVGPGLTNTITGIAGAWLDSIPVLYISGQVKRDNMIGGSGLRQLGVQEVDAPNLVKTISKYAVVVLDQKDIRYHLEKAVYLAKSGRPGPVLIDVPSDVQSAIVNTDELLGFKPDMEEKFVDNSLSPKISDFKKMINSAKRPLLFIGHGIRLAKGEDVLMKVIEKLQIPVVTSMSAHDLIPSEHGLCVGRPGVFGDRAGNFAVQNCDLLISVGVRHHLWNIGYNYNEFAKKSKKIVIDIDKLELSKKTIHPDLPINIDAKVFLNEVLNMTSDGEWKDSSDWVSRCIAWKEKYPVVLPEYKDEKNFVNSYYFTEVLASLLKKGEIILTGVGTSFTATLQCFKIKKNQRLISNVGCAAMGYDLPAAIGACFANDKKRVILITGDGSIMMNIQELQTIKHHNLPIKVFLLNNQGYLAIRNTQNSFFGGDLEASDPSSGVSFPDFRKVVAAFGIQYSRIKDHKGIEKKIDKVLKSKGPVVCEINMSAFQPLIPKVYSMKNSDGTMDSKPLEDMFPFLKRDEYSKNMNNV
ncbi:MAG: thiamine pyrophosphate-binding protein [Candidatus Magasanikbacteria bacterium]